MASSFEELLGLGSYAGNHASQGRVSVLNLQEVTGTTAFDTGGVGNNGTYWGTGSNPVSVPGPTAWLPNAVSFDGINVRVDYGGEVASLDDWTIACWFRTTQTGNDRWVMSEGSTANNTPGIGIVVQSGNLRCFCRSSGTVNLITSKTVNDGNWHFAQFSRSGIDFYVYCDGELIASGGSLVDNPATNISGIGCFRRASASLFAQAQIAGVYKFSRMLSLSEHQFLFAGPEGDEEPITALAADVLQQLKAEQATASTVFLSTPGELAATPRVEAAVAVTAFNAVCHDITIQAEVIPATASAGQQAIAAIAVLPIEIEMATVAVSFTATCHDVVVPSEVESAEVAVIEAEQAVAHDIALPAIVESAGAITAFTASCFDITLPLSAFSVDSVPPTGPGQYYALRTADQFIYLRT